MLLLSMTSVGRSAVYQNSLKGARAAGKRDKNVPTDSNVLDWLEANCTQVLNTRQSNGSSIANKTLHRLSSARIHLSLLDFRLAGVMG